MDTVQAKMEVFCDRLKRCETLDDLNSFVDWLHAFLEVDHVAYHVIVREKGPYGIVTYTPEWADYYMSENFQRTDPVVLNALSRFHPYDWKSLSWDTRPARGLLIEAIDAGLGNQGLSIPVRAPNGEIALFSVNHKTSDEYWAHFSQTHMHMLLLIAHYLHQKVREIDCRSSEVSIPVLSPRELDTLKFIAAGKSRGQVAEHLKISEHTLRVYLEAARYKLGAANTVSAVAKAVSSGIIKI